MRELVRVDPSTLASAASPDTLPLHGARLPPEVERTIAATLAQVDPGDHPIDVSRLPLLVVVDGAASPEGADLVRLAVLGRGGMGVVEVAWQRSLRRIVAVKRLRDDGGPPPDAHVRALLREATISGHLEHPNIVPVHLLGHDASGSPLFVMKRVEGESWGRLLEDPAHRAWEAAGSDRLAWTIGVLGQLCNAVSYAHSRGVVHRDIKPDNVMIGAFGEVYLVDWGVALWRGDPEPPDAGPALVGTPGYMPPELARLGDEPADERTDVYLLGGCLFQALSGAPPHPGVTVSEVLLAAREGTVAALGPEVPSELAAICGRALAPARDDRFPSARALKAALDDYVRHRASSRLTDKAEQRLGELRARVEAATTAADVRAARALDECLFAFEQALGDWPENPRVPAGVREAVLLGCRLAIGQRNPAAVRALLARIADAPPEIVAEVEALERRIEAERSALLVLTEIERDFDPGVGRVPRERIFRGVGLALGLLGLLVIPAAVLGVAFADRRFYVSSIIGPLVVLTFASAAAFSFRERLLGNRVSRFYAACFALMLASLSMNRLAGLILEQPFAHTFVRDFLVTAVVSTSAALVIERIFYVTAAVCVAGYAASLAVPSAAPGIFMAVILLDIAILAVAKVRRPRRWAPRPWESAPPSASSTGARPHAR